MVKDIVAEDHLSIFGKSVESDEHFFAVELALRLKDPASENGPNMVNSIFSGFQIEKKEAFQKRRRF
jgi:hypothetical protein